MLQLLKVQPCETFAQRVHPFLGDCRTAQKRYGSTSNMSKLLVKSPLVKAKATTAHTVSYPTIPCVPVL